MKNLLTIFALVISTATMSFAGTRAQAPLGKDRPQNCAKETRQHPRLGYWDLFIPPTKGNGY